MKTIGQLLPTVLARYGIPWPQPPRQLELPTMGGHHRPARKRRSKLPPADLTAKARRARR